MSIEGELVVRVKADGGRVTHARAHAERPRVAGRLFTGRACREAAPLAGALFAICGRSQAVAAGRAVESARGEAPPAPVTEARDARIAAETVNEHAWRLLVDWPKLAGLAPQVEALAVGRRALAPLLEAREAPAWAGARDAALDWATRSIFGIPPCAFLDFCTADDFGAWMEQRRTPVAALAASLVPASAALGASDVAFLPYGDDGWVARELAQAIAGDERFDDAPHWQGEPRETGPLARVSGHPLVASAIAAWGRGLGARLVARLVETASALDAFGGRHGAANLGDATAIAWVETARGLLVHRVALDGERIAGYRIVAPTEWNFHPEGAFTRGAMGLHAASAPRLERDVRWLVASLDPCVGVRYEAGHA